MTKKVAVINDLSGLGRCSLTARHLRIICDGNPGLSTPYRHFKFTNRIPQLLLL